jgi:hypothetical protein
MPVAARKPATLPSPAELLELIAARKAELPALLKRQSDAAEQSVSSGDETEYRAAVDAVAALHADVTRVEAALTGAEIRDREAQKAQRLAALAAQAERCSKLLDARMATVARIESAIGELVKAWRDLIEQSDKALAVLPPGVPVGGLAVSNLELIQLVGAELFRQGATVPVTGTPQLGRLPPTIPGPKCPDYMMLNQPEKITKLSVAIEQANAVARSIMENKQHAAA